MIYSSKRGLSSFAKLAQNGQGSKFQFYAQTPINVRYSTFWNDFTYYTYNMEGGLPDSHIFADAQNFKEQVHPGFTYSESTQ